MSANESITEGDEPIHSASSRPIAAANRFLTLRLFQALLTLPGLGLAFAAVAIAHFGSLIFPSFNMLLIAIVLGIAVRNLIPLPRVFNPGLNFSAKRLLRLGIVLLGLQLAIGSIVSLGPGIAVLIVLVVIAGFTTTLVVGHWLGVNMSQRLLIACGFSICGAAAVAAAEGVLETEDESEVITAIALVVLFGTLMIPTIPLLTSLLGLTQLQGGLWAGAAVHEVAQVVAAGGAISSIALELAVLVKLGRVLLLAPVVMGLSIYRRRVVSRTASQNKKPPLVPLFVLGFIGMMALASSGLVPPAGLEVASMVQAVVLAAAMFALGASVEVRSLLRVGPRPLLLALAATVAIALVALGGTFFVI